MKSNNISNNKKLLKPNTYLLFKRVIDLTVSLIVSPIALLFILFFGLLIKLESKGSCIFRQERVGKDNKIFILYKLRSMYINSEENGPQWAQKKDPRVTKVGKFIRNTRIDELPQIINILKGDMSIIGPRPERPYFVEQFSVIPNYNERFNIKPGLTGWAQVNGGYELTPEQKLEKDLYYIKNQSLWLDIKIILKTIKIIFSRVGAR